MIPAVLDHLWQSTLVALGAGVLAMSFRKARASVRYGLWLAASAKFLVPFAALAAAGRLLAPAVRPPAGATSDAAFIARAAQPFSQSIPAPPAAEAAIASPIVSPAVHAAAHAAIPLDPAAILLGVWALGCAAVLVFWMARWAKVRSAVRQAAPLAWPAPMPVLASSWMREPGLVGLWRPVLLVPETLFGHLRGPEIDALVAHEACHLRRRDNLTAALHMLVEALFWFHPLVWWIGARLIDERERACDEAVVRSGHDRAAYARSLVECSRLYLQSPLTCVAGASGSYLKRRVEMIMTGPPNPPLSRAGKTLLVAAGACALASPVAAGWLASPTGQQAAAHVEAIASEAAAVRIGSPRAVRAAPATASTYESAPANAIEVAQGKTSNTPVADAPASSEEGTPPNPGVEDAIRRWIAGLQAHQPDYDDMSPDLRQAARRRDALAMQMFRAFGALTGLRFTGVAQNGEDAYEADFTHARIEVVAGPLTADGKLDHLNWRPIWAKDGAPQEPGAPLAPAASVAMSVTPIAQVKVSQPLLMRVSDRTPEAGQPLGPGHYVDRSGLKSSAGCGEIAPWYALSTRPVAPGHIITNFHYELRGRNHCDGEWPSDAQTAACALTVDKPDKKTVRFQLLANGNYCFSYQTTERDGPVGNLYSGGTVTQEGAVTHSEMVLSYDVQ